MVIRLTWEVLDLQWVDLDRDLVDPIPEWVQWVAQDLWEEWVDQEGLLGDLWVAHLVLVWVDPEKE